jgi:hypothetical protein
MRYTLILIPETAQGNVRKLQVQTRWLRAVSGSAVVLAALAGWVLFDYVRMRGELVELPALRAERTLQRDQLQRCSAMARCSPRSRASSSACASSSASCA